VRGGSRRRRLPRRSRMECFGGERPGASAWTSADVCARSHELRAIRRLGVSHLLFLRAGGAETLRQWIAKRRPHGNVEGATARWPKRPRIGVGTPWTAAALVAAKRAGSKPSRRWKTSWTERTGGGNPGESGPASLCRRRGVKPQEGKDSAVTPGPGTSIECPERGPSLREPLRTPVRSRPADGTPRGRTPRRGGSGEPVTPLHRTESAPRGRATL